MADEEEKKEAPEEAGEQDDAAMADEWAAAMEESGDEGDAAAEGEAAAEGAEGGEEAADGGGMTGADGKTLSQSEIDSLLGFGGGDDAKTGIHALLDKALLSYERLPMLEIVFDRFVRTLSTSLRNFTSDNVDITIDSITSMRFEDYLNTVPLPALLSIFQAVEWENYGIITIDSSLTYSMVDVLLGGGRTHRPVKIEGRPFTTIEQDIVKSLSSLMLEDMSSAFNPLTPVTFRFERLETNPRFATITRPSNAVILISLRVDMEERGGKAEILLPYATLEPVKDLLIQMFTGESFGGDAQWETHMSNEVRNTYVELMAMLPPKNVVLRDIAKLDVGSTIVLDTGPDDAIEVRCKGIPMMSGRMGDSNSHIAIKIDDLIQRETEDELA
jgi:flagellar motor switch protein FliM